jgi:hypothetical protein
MSARVSGVFSEVNPLRLSNPVLSSLQDYWQRKRGQRAMPARADINPAELKAHVGWVVLVDALPALSDFRFRIIGTRVSDYFPPNSTGKLVSEAFAPYGEAIVRVMQASYRKVTRERIVLHAWGAADWVGKEFLDFDALYLPLSDDGATVNMVLSAVTFELASPLKRSPQS